MRLRGLGLLLSLIVCAIVPIAIYAIVRATTERTPASAADELTALSRRAERATYFARNAQRSDDIGSDTEVFARYHAPEVGSRLDLPEPVSLDADDDDLDDLLKGGDILILNAHILIMPARASNVPQRGWT